MNDFHVILTDVCEPPGNLHTVKHDAQLLHWVDVQKGSVKDLMKEPTFQTMFEKIDESEEGEYKDDDHGFEQCLFDEIDTRRRDGDNRQGGNTDGDNSAAS